MTRLIASFAVAGIPKAQPRPRAFASGGKARVYDPGTAEGWKSAVAAAAMGHRPKEPLESAVELNISLYLPRPKRLMRRNDSAGCIPHTSRPDLDNLEKAVLDALTAIGFWRDDAQVFSMQTSKHYCAKGGRPGATIEVYVWESDSKASGERLC